MTFNLWGEEHRIRFSYEYEGTQRRDTYVWFERRNAAGEWVPLGNAPGHAYLHTNDTFNGERGRKLALARYLQNLGWSKGQRAIVWAAYLNRDRLNRPKPKFTPRQEQEMWDNYQSTLRYAEELEQVF